MLMLAKSKIAPATVYYSSNENRDKDSIGKSDGISKFAAKVMESTLYSATKKKI